jgi:hypothetical protein
MPFSQKNNKKVNLQKRHYLKKLIVYLPHMNMGGKYWFCVGKKKIADFHVLGLFIAINMI